MLDDQDASHAGNRRCPPLESGHDLHPTLASLAAMGAVDGQELVIARGDGARVWDTAGREYFDASGGLWYNAVGHGRQEIAAAIGPPGGPAGGLYLLRRLLRRCHARGRRSDRGITPVRDPRVFLTSGGSDSVDSAGKIIRRYFALRGEPERTVIIAREGAYHGMHAYGTALAGIPANHDPWGDLVPEVEHITAFNVEALEERIEAVGVERVAAFIVEPVIGAGGVFPPPDGYMAAVAEVCRRHGVLLVCDEVVTGVGRMGRWTASERYGVEPDLMTLAKVLTSGYQPLGAVVVSGAVAEPFFDGDGRLVETRLHLLRARHRLRRGDRQPRHHRGEGLVDRVAELEPALPRLLGPLTGLDGVEEVRTAGLLAAIQLDAATAGGAPRDCPTRSCARRQRYGVLTRALRGVALQLSPPFVTGEEGPAAHGRRPRRGRRRVRRGGSLAAMRRIELAVALALLMDAALYGAVVPLLPYYAQRFDLSKLEAGLVLAAYPAVVLLLSVP